MGRRLLLTGAIAVATIGGIVAVTVEASGGALERAAHPDWALLAMAFVVVALAQPLRAMAWRTTLRQPVDFRAVYAASAVGSFLDTILPARLGEASKVGVLRVTSGRSWPGVSRAAGSLVCAHMLEGIAFVLVGAAAAAFLPVPAWARLSLVGGFVLATGAVALAAILDRKGLRCLPAGARQFLAAVALPPRVLLHAEAILLATWIVRWLGMVVLLRAFGIEATLGVALVYVVVTGLANTAPILPGNAGLYQGAAVAAFALVGEAGSSAVAVGLVAPLFASLVTAAAAIAGVAAYGRRMAVVSRAALVRA